MKTQEKIIAEEITQIIMENNIRVQLLSKVLIDLIHDYKESMFNTTESCDFLDEAAAHMEKAIKLINRAEENEELV